MLTAARFASRLVENHGDLIVRRNFSTLLKNVSTHGDHAGDIRPISEKKNEFKFQLINVDSISDH